MLYIWQRSIKKSCLVTLKTSHLNQQKLVKSNYLGNCGPWVSRKPNNNSIGSFSSSIFFAIPYILNFSKNIPTFFDIIPR